MKENENKKLKTFNLLIEFYKYDFSLFVMNKWMFGVFSSIHLR